MKKLLVYTLVFPVSVHFFIAVVILQQTSRYSPVPENSRETGHLVEVVPWGQVYWSLLTYAVISHFWSLMLTLHLWTTNPAVPVRLWEDLDVQATCWITQVVMIGVGSQTQVAAVSVYTVLSVYTAFQYTVYNWILCLQLVMIGGRSQTQVAAVSFILEDLCVL